MLLLKSNHLLRILHNKPYMLAVLVIVESLQLSGNCLRAQQAEVWPIFILCHHSVNS